MFVIKYKNLLIYRWVLVKIKKKKEKKINKQNEI